MGVRFEVTIRKPSQYVKLLKKNNLNIEMCNYEIKILETAQTELLTRHRALLKYKLTYFQCLKFLGDFQLSEAAVGGSCRRVSRDLVSCSNDLW